MKLVVYQMSLDPGLELFGLELGERQTGVNSCRRGQGAFISSWNGRLTPPPLSNSWAYQSDTHVRAAIAGERHLHHQNEWNRHHLKCTSSGFLLYNWLEDLKRAAIPPSGKGRQTFLSCNPLHDGHSVSRRFDLWTLFRACPLLVW